MAETIRKICRAMEQDEKEVDDADAGMVAEEASP